MWKGELFYAEYLVAYRGAAGDNSDHAHATLQISWGLKDALVLETGEGVIADSGPIVVRPGLQHRLHATPGVLLMLVEPQSAPARFILDRLGSNGAGPMPDLFPDDLPRVRDLRRIAETVMQIGGGGACHLDPRLARALAFLGQVPLKGAISAAAEEAGLSQSRLRTLANEGLGVPLSKWLLWAAVRRAGTALVEGASLADAAVAGGFADQAHYTRTLRNLMGVTPAMARAALV